MGVNTAWFYDSSGFLQWLQPFTEGLGYSICIIHTVIFQCQSGPLRPDRVWLVDSLTPMYFVTSTIFYFSLIIRLPKLVLFNSMPIIKVHPWLLAFTLHFSLLSSAFLFISLQMAFPSENTKLSITSLLYCCHLCLKNSHLLSCYLGKENIYHT